MRTNPRSVIIASVFIWAGFVAAISFMEAWVKFRAPGVTLTIGLSIGRYVFSALNKVEWALLLLIGAASVVLRRSGDSVGMPLLIVLASLLLLQTVWLLPWLDARAVMRLRGERPPPSSAHFFYIGTEALKLSCLLILGRYQLVKLYRHAPTGDATGR